MLSQFWSPRTYDVNLDIFLSYFHAFSPDHLLLALCTPLNPCYFHLHPLISVLHWYLSSSFFQHALSSSCILFFIFFFLFASLLSLPLYTPTCFLVSSLLSFIQSHQSLDIEPRSLFSLSSGLGAAAATSLLHRSCLSCSCEQTWLPLPYGSAKRHWGIEGAKEAEERGSCWMYCFGKHTPCCNGNGQHRQEPLGKQISQRFIATRANSQFQSNWLGLSTKDNNSCALELCYP